MHLYHKNSFFAIKYFYVFNKVLMLLIKNSFYFKKIEQLFSQFLLFFFNHILIFLFLFFLLIGNFFSQLQIKEL